MTGSGLPAGIGMSRVDVHRSEAPDGQCGGTPHVHLVCAEMYVVIAGTGAAEFLTPAGPRREELRPGAAVSFTPGTVHRLVTEPSDPLRILVIMENGDLNEQGDVVFCFPDADLADPARYAELAGARSAAEVRARRDRAVRGFTLLAEAWRRSPAEGSALLGAFHRRAATLLRSRAAAWPPRVAAGPGEVYRTLAARAEAVAAGDSAHAGLAEVTVLPAPDPAGLVPRMCGELWPYRRP
jgi:uncharacterized cupin superfamily protein